jgi:hypothetical protein
MTVAELRSAKAGCGVVWKNSVAFYIKPVVNCAHSGAVSHVLIS